MKANIDEYTCPVSGCDGVMIRMFAPKQKKYFWACPESRRHNLLPDREFKPDFRGFKVVN